MQAPKITEVDRLVLQAILSSQGRKLYGLTKLQKLLFIAAHPKEFGLSIARPIGSLKFVVYKHGPFCEDVYRSVERLDAANWIDVTKSQTDRSTEGVVEPGFEDERAGPRILYVYEAKQGAQEETVGANEHDLRLVKEAAKKWGWLTPGQIEDFVNRRVGLTPELKEQFMGCPWEDFVRFAAKDLKPRLSEPTEAYWRSEQAFNRERRQLVREHGEGQFVAYAEGRRVGIGRDDVALFDEVTKRTGAPPDFIGYLNEAGIRSVMAPAAG